MSMEEGVEAVSVPQLLVDTVDDEQAKVYAVRADIRNSFRTFFERHAVVARFLHTVHLPEVTAEDVQRDEDVYTSVLAKKYCKHLVFHCVEDACRFIRKTRENDISIEQRQSEEEVRYVVMKIQAYLKCGAYDQVMELCEAAPSRFERDSELLDFFVDSLKTPIFEHLKSLLIDRRASDFVRAYLDIKRVMSCDDFDISDLIESLQEDEAFQCSLQEYLANCVKLHPRIYSQTKSGLTKLGVLNDQNIELSLEVQHEVQMLIENFALAGPEPYMVLWNVLVETELIDEQGVCEKDILEDVVVLQLASLMEKSPRLYSAMCERWAKSRNLLKNEVDKHERIRSALDRLLIRQIEVHPRMYEQFRRMAAFHGMEPYDEEMLERTLKSKEESLKNSSQWIDDCTNDDLSFFMNQHDAECSQELQRQTRLSERLLEDFASALTEYEKKYPQLMKGRKSMLGRILPEDVSSESDLLDR